MNHPIPPTHDFSHLTPGGAGPTQPNAIPRGGFLVASQTIDHTVSIVAAYVSHNPVSQTDLPALISNVHGAIDGLLSPQPITEPAALVPAVPVKKSITPDYLICLEDGVKLKSLKRHLWTAFKLTPEQYREKWGLPKDYPMVAPNYSIQRSQLAKNTGLGKKR